MRRPVLLGSLGAHRGPMRLQLLALMVVLVAAVCPAPVRGQPGEPLTIGAPLRLRFSMRFTSPNPSAPQLVVEETPPGRTLFNGPAAIRRTESFEGLISAYELDQEITATAAGPAGEHTITATVRSSAGATLATQRYTIMVREGAPPPPVVAAVRITSPAGGAVHPGDRLDVCATVTLQSGAAERLRLRLLAVRAGVAQELAGQPAAPGQNQCATLTIPEVLGPLTLRAEVLEGAAIAAAGEITVTVARRPPNPDNVTLTGWRWADPATIPVALGCSGFPLGPRALAAAAQAVERWRAAEGLQMALAPGDAGCLADRAATVVHDLDVPDNPAAVFAIAFRQDESRCHPDEDCVIFTGVVVFNTAVIGDIGDGDLAWQAARAIGRLLGLGDAARCTGYTLMHADPTCRRDAPGAEDIEALNQRLRGER